MLPVYKKDVGPAIAVVVDDGDSAAGGFDDVALMVDAAVDVADGDSGLRGDVDEPGGRGVVGGGGVDGLWAELWSLGGGGQGGKEGEDNEKAGPSTSFGARPPQRAQIARRGPRCAPNFAQDDNLWVGARFHTYF